MYEGSLWRISIKGDIVSKTILRPSHDRGKAVNDGDDILYTFV